MFFAVWLRALLALRRTAMLHRNVRPAGSGHARSEAFMMVQLQGRMAGSGRGVRLIAAAMLMSGGLAASALHATTARAVETTDVLDAADDQNGDPWDGAVRLRFQSETRTSGIARQARCLSGDVLGTACPKSNAYVLDKELDYSRTRNWMSVDLRAGIYKDLEIYAFLPIVLSDQSKMSFASGVTSENSTIMPPSAKDALFDARFKGTDRSGFGDATFGLKWSPFNYFRDASEPTWVMGIEYVAPTGTAMQAGNTGVGYGLHELTLYSTISRRALQIFEPFVNVHFTPVRQGSSTGLFQSYGQTQRYVNPGITGGASAGLTLVPWENLARDERLEVEGGFSMDYIARGREYSEIWEALGAASNPCKPGEGCSNVLYSKSDVDPSTGKPRRTDGITEVESYGRFQGWAAIHYQPIKYFQLSAKFGYATETPHYITYGDYGVDLDGHEVNQSNTNGVNEFSPVFLPSVDQPGQRLRVINVGTTMLMFSATGKF